MKSLVLLHPDWMQIITDCFWLSAHLSNQITKKVSCFLIQSEFSHPHSTWWWYWLYWQRFVYWLISAEMNSLLMIIDEVYWCWLLYCPCILLMSVCEADSDSVGQYWLISSVTTEIYWSCPWPSFWQQQFLPLPWRVKKKRSYVLYLISFYYFCLERRLSVCLPEKELEEVEVEATEEGEVSEEEEGRPCVCERSQLLSWKADSCQIVHEA